MDASYRLGTAIVLGTVLASLGVCLVKTPAAPAEIPIGVITAFLGAPFFVLVLRTTRARPT